MGAADDVVRSRGELAHLAVRSRPVELVQLGPDRPVPSCLLELGGEAEVTNRFGKRGVHLGAFVDRAEYQAPGFVRVRGDLRVESAARERGGSAVQPCAFRRALEL